MKKSLKICAVYLVFGILIAAMISLSGAYENLIINQVFGAITLIQYIIFMLLVVVLWLPTFVFLIFTASDYLRYEYYNIILVGVIAAFVILAIIIIKHNKSKNNN